jgi:hypothetical protein
LTGARSNDAKKAFATRDPEMSRLAHDLAAAPEQHMKGSGQYIKAAVFGGLDGIITTFAVVASVTGANLSTGVVIIMVKGLYCTAWHSVDLTVLVGLCQPACGWSFHGNGRVPLRLV